MKYKVNEDIAEPFEVSSVKIEKSDSDHRVRHGITTGLFLILAILIIGGLVLTFKNNDSDMYKSLLNSITPFVAISIGYYFGTQKRNQ